MLSNILDRHRARFESERVATSGDVNSAETRARVDNDSDDDGAAVVDLEHGEATTSGTSETLNETTTNVETVSDDDEEASETQQVDEDNDDNESQEFRHSITLAELEEERELARRRSSACVMFAVFLLFRLWMLAIQTGDFGLLLLCLVGTSWTARWVRHTRDREEELDRRIAEYMQNNNNSNNSGGGDLRMLSFQAQLAMAIMESQRQMMENGGYGNPDTNSTPGVSTQAKTRWENFSFKVVPSHHYGSVQQDDNINNKEKSKKQNQEEGEDEAPHCSICLSEYEDGESLVRLPCSHIYHGECIESWTTNHTKCPLCNFDLESASSNV